MVVVEQGRMGRLFLAVQSLKRRAVDQIDVRPAVVVVVDQADAGAVGLDDEALLRHAHLVDPAGKPAFLVMSSKTTGPESTKPPAVMGRFCSS